MSKRSTSELRPAPSLIGVAVTMLQTLDWWV